jgi:acetolactate synthase-1/3 small subunit
MMLHTFIVYVEDKPGVLARVAILVRRRAFNIDSLTVGRTEEPGVSRMTIVIESNEHAAHRIQANLYKLVNVLWVENVTGACVARDMALIKVAVAPESQQSILDAAKKFGGKVVEHGNSALIVEVTGSEEIINELLEALRPFGVLEMVRTGRIAMTKSTFASKRPKNILATEIEKSEMGVRL